jgi:hypothetical protein
MRMRRLAILVITLGLGAHPVTAADTPTMGGTGGDAFRTLCPADSVLVGINGRSGSYIDRARGMCAKFVDGGWTNAVDLTSTSGHGSTTGGQPFDIRCPTGSAVVGLTGRAGWFVDQINVFCGRLNPLTRRAFLVLFDERTGVTGESSGHSAVGRAGGGGDPQLHLACGSDNPAIGLFGKAHDFVDRLGLACDTPFVADAGGATPSPRVQVTLVGLANRLPLRKDRQFGVQLVNLGPQSVRQFDLELSVDGPNDGTSEIRLADASALVNVGVRSIRACTAQVPTRETCGVNFGPGGLLINGAIVVLPVRVRLGGPGNFTIRATISTEASQPPPRRVPSSGVNPDPLPKGRPTVTRAASHTVEVGQ